METRRPVAFAIVCVFALLVSAWWSVAADGKVDLATLRQEAEKGNAKAQLGLGACYARGNGVPKNLAEAVKWYRKAAEQGEVAAQVILGCQYGKGEGVERDATEAVR